MGLYSFVSVQYSLILLWRYLLSLRHRAYVFLFWGVKINGTFRKLMIKMDKNGKDCAVFPISLHLENKNIFI